MILTEFLLAPTVPSLPSPKKTARTTSSALDRELGVVLEAQVRDVVDDADGEGRFGLGFVSSSKTAAAMAGVNSLEDRP